MKTRLANMIRRTGTTALVAAVLAGSGLPASAATLSLSPLPLFLGGMIEPNIMLTLDDSGSMFWSYMPDAINVDYNVKRGLAANWNGMAYNPAITYVIPPGPDGAQLPAPRGYVKGTKKTPDQWWTWDDGYKHYAKTKGWTAADSCEVNLNTSYRPTWHYDDNYDHCDDSTDYTISGFPEYHRLDTTPQRAYYYKFDGTNSGCDGSATDEDCYDKVVVSDAEMLNFANWYTYYRKRTYTAKAGIARAFNNLGAGMRVGFGRINKGSETIDGASTATIARGVRTFTGSDKTEFFKLLFLAPASGGTPTRRAAEDVGRYFDDEVVERRHTDSRSAWDDTPGIGTDTATALTCRSAYHILMSDGYWNSDSVSVGNVDSTAKADFPEVSGVDPFKDGYSDTLADVAMKYYMNDLQDGLADEVPKNRHDEAEWQHLVTFAVGLGVTGLTINPDDAFAAIKTADPIAWPDPLTGSPYTVSVPARLDDMLHAAVNSRGGFFAAQDPDEFATALAAFINSIVSRSGSAASVVLNSGTLNDQSRVYQAKFDTANWTGQLLAYGICDGTPDDVADCTGKEEGAVGVLKWDAAEKMLEHSARTIVTFNESSGVGVPFRWTDESGLKTVLAAPFFDTDDDLTTSEIPVDALLEFLRGSDEWEEKNEGPFRNRVRGTGAASPLGDIISSAPAYMAPPNAPYFDFWGDGAPESATTAAYSKFRLDNVGRDPIIFVGANDGMLHAFDAQDGIELFAYVPASVVSRLDDLADPNYAHTNFVDGSPTVGDAFFDGRWRTVVASGLNGGGQGVFALDVTDPTDWISETSVAAKVLWEFTDADTDCSTWSKGDRGDCDLGFTFSRPNIVRLNNGKWAAIFGNGYNSTVADGATSTTGDAVLFVVDIETGGLISKISTKEGASDDPLGESRPNGLASVAPVDVDGDFIVDYVYAGDLFGNLWKFNLNDPDEDNWGVAFGSKTTPAPLYVARSASDDVQPITTRPQVMRHPMGGEGFLVLFGTGKYLEVGDNSAIGQVTQSFYGILDAGTAFTGRGDLLQQSILAEVTATTATDPPVTYDYRVTSNAPITWGSKGKKGWYLDLVNTEDGGTANFGERQVSDAILRGGRIIFTTLVPESDDPCNFGGTGWLMELDAASGGRLEGEIFDVNGDGVFTMADVVDYLGTSGDKSDDVLPSGRRSKEGIIPMPAILARQAGGKEFKYLSGSTGNIEVVSENPGLGDFGRQSWQQLLK